MPVESSPLSIQELEELRADLKREMDWRLAAGTIELDKANDLQRRARKAGWFSRWALELMAAGHDRRGKAHLREVMRIRRALKNGDEAAYGGHRGARRLLHRQVAGGR